MATTPPDTAPIVERAVDLAARCPVSRFLSILDTRRCQGRAAPRCAARLAWVLLLSGLLSCGPPLQVPLLPETHEPVLDTSHAVMADGYVLPIQSWQPPDPPRAVVLALHGFNEYRDSFTAVGPYLALHGIATYAYDQRGFGTTAHRGLWAGTESLARDAAELSRLLRRAYPGLPVYLLGESMGGAVAIASVTGTYRAAVDGVVLVAPAVWGRKLMNPFIRGSLWLLLRTWPSLQLTGRALKIRASSNDDALWRLSRDPLVIKATRVDAVAGLVDLMDTALGALPRLKLPSLILYGAHDQLIPQRSFDTLIELLPRRPQARWRAAFYPQGYHMLTRDLEAAVVLRDIVTWLFDHQAALPSGSEWRPGSPGPLLAGPLSRGAGLTE
ncbi:MAG: lysophospholipase [Pseudomonadota bacterium]|nr:alpha/beta hydrolase [Gammaproteobacteria bacterium]MDQ3582233.1 lysophospholipase [Pseudomonadota bacterium]